MIIGAKREVGPRKGDMRGRESQQWWRMALKMRNWVLVSNNWEHNWGWGG